MKSITIFFFLVLSASAFAGGGSSIGPENPASKFCADQGGTEITVDQEHWGGNQSGLCRFLDDGMINSWTLMGYHGSRARDAFFDSYWGKMQQQGPMDTWAIKYCESLGGTVNNGVLHLKPTIRYEWCEFEDRSAIELWTLYGGPNLYPDLAKALQ